MNFIQKEDTVLCLFHQTFTFPVCAGIGTLYISEQLSQQKLWIIRIFGTVENNKRCSLLQYTMILGILIHDFRKHRLTRTCWSHQQCMQAKRRIDHSRLCLVDHRLQTFITADQLIEIIFGIHFSSFLQIFLQRGNSKTFQ